MDQFRIEAIGVVRGGRTEAIDDHWGDVEAAVVLDHERFAPDALAGLNAYSHIDVVFVFDRVAERDIVAGARHPRGRTDWPAVGIFAQRARMRPNRIGVTTCELLDVDAAALTLRVRGLDAMDGTPVVDVKPYMVEFGPRSSTRQPEWATELMRDYW
jgi:tRNA-Thr(GGU) m(6)t(6)A37 methyltransferase TsaA